MHNNTLEKLGFTPGHVYRGPVADKAMDWLLELLDPPREITPHAEHFAKLGALAHRLMDLLLVHGCLVQSMAIGDTGISVTLHRDPPASLGVEGRSLVVTRVSGRERSYWRGRLHGARIEWPANDADRVGRGA